MSKVTTGFKVVNYYDGIYTSSWVIEPNQITYNKHEWSWPSIKGTRLFAFSKRIPAFKFIKNNGGMVFECDCLDSRDFYGLLPSSSNGLLNPRDLDEFWSCYRHDESSVVAHSYALDDTLLARAIRIKEKIVSPR